jgi:hypothetical protein
MPIIALGAVRGVFAVSEQDKKIELTVAPGVVLILSRHAERAPCGFQAILMFIGSLLHIPKVLAFMPFDHGDAWIGRHTDGEALWIGRSCYHMPAAQLRLAAQFLGIAVPADCA